MASPPSTSISFAPNAEPFDPVPIISDILRTQYCVPDSILLVERVEVLPLRESSRWRVVRLLLGDGQLCIQALLRPEMHRFIDLTAIRVGCYVRIGNFSLSFKRLDTETFTDKSHRMAYLIVDDLVTIGWNTALTTPPANFAINLPDPGEDDAEWDDGEHHHSGYLLEGLEDEDMELRACESARFLEGPDDDDANFGGSSDVDDRQGTATFGRADAANIEQGVVKQGRDEAENNNGSESRLRPPTSPTRDVRPYRARQSSGPVSLLRDWTDPSVPLKLTPLRSIPNLPYKQNWSINVLTIVVSLSDLEPSHLPPYTQRTARLADPSTRKQVHLTVFLDPEEFCPAVGSPVLLVGVKNHRFDGGSLKKYVSDKPKSRAVRWWYPDPSHLSWCDAKDLTEWWSQYENHAIEE